MSVNKNKQKQIKSGTGHLKPARVRRVTFGCWHLCTIPTYTLQRTLKNVRTEEEGESNFTLAGVCRDDRGGRRAAQCLLILSPLHL